jgi:hypothetical protein
LGAGAAGLAHGFDHAGAVGVGLQSAEWHILNYPDIPLFRGTAVG